MRSASARVSFWSGSKPPGGWPLASCRVTVAWKFWIGDTSSTGASVPLRMRAPVSRSFRHDVGPLGHARVAEALRGPGPVRGAVDPLHGGEDAQLPEARDVRGVEDLRVLDAEAGVLRRRVLAEGRLVGVEHDPVGAVPDGVGPDLEAVGEGEARGLQDPLGRRDQQARVAGVVRVGLEERRATGAERAVGVELDRADGQHPLAGVRRPRARIVGRPAAMT